MTWQELGDGVFRHRYESLDLNIGLILGEEAAMVVDSRANQIQGDELIADISSFTSLPVLHLVNTHHHWDHTFGNGSFGSSTIVGHERCRSHLMERGESMRQRLVEADWIPNEQKPAFGAVEISPPTTTFAHELSIDVGGRPVELTYLGRGHTDNDIIIEVDDTVFAGDLVEEGAPPQFGDAFPREWLTTLDLLIGRTRGTVVPGHGDVVGRAFVKTQRDQIARAIDGEAVFPDPIMRQLHDRLEA